jgi:hypothetical protein
MYSIIDGGFVIGYISPRLYKIPGSATALLVHFYKRASPCNLGAGLRRESLPNEALISQ